MATPRYRPEQFIDSGWDSGTAERKARFVNSLLRFTADDFPRERFTRPLYLGLSTHGYFGFIAHYDIHGFYDEQISTPARRERSVRDLARDCQKDAHLDRPDLWSDVKVVLASRLMLEQEPVPSRRRLAPSSSFGARQPAARPDAPTLF